LGGRFRRLGGGGGGIRVVSAFRFCKAMDWMEISSSEAMAGCPRQCSFSRLDSIVKKVETDDSGVLKGVAGLALCRGICGIISTCKIRHR